MLGISDLIPKKQSHASKIRAIGSEIAAFAAETRQYLGQWSRFGPHVCADEG